MNDQFRAFIEHPLALCTVQARYTNGKTVITGILLNKPGTAARRFISDRRLDAVARLLRSLLDGTGNGADECLIDLSWCTPFQRSVLASARKIPRGTTVSYAGLAGMAGYPDAVRAAASVMRQNRFPLIIPCHRVIRRDGTMGGFMGKQHGWAIELKQSLQENEKKPRTAARCCR